MTKLNPLLEAMNGIDDKFVFDTAKNSTNKRKKRIGTMIIAAAAAAACTVASVTAIASLKADRDITVNGVLTDPDYSEVTYNGTTYSVYVFDLPKEVLDEEKEGGTAVGKVKVVRNNDGKFGNDWKIVDEAGNSFYVGINNKLVRMKSKDGVNDIGFAVLNLSDDYCWFEYDFGKDIKIDLVHKDDLDEYTKAHAEELHLPAEE